MLTSFTPSNLEQLLSYYVLNLRQTQLPTLSGTEMSNSLLSVYYVTQPSATECSGGIPACCTEGPVSAATSKGSLRC